MGRILRLLSVASIACVAATPGRAQSVEQFYANRVISLYIGFSVGGGYDIYGRLVARHIGKHIPGNPTVVPTNMEGAGSLKLMNWLYDGAPRDGSAIEPLVGIQEFARFDATTFTWIGSVNDEVSVCVAWKSTGITEFSELYERELIVGGTGQGAEDVFSKLISGVLGVRLRLITGYAGGNEVNYAMERGEVDGRCGWSWSSIKSTRQQWLDDGSIKILLQVALRKHPDLPDIPLIMDLADNEEKRQILRLVLGRGVLGRPFLAPPGVPADRAAALQHAFDAMVRDPEFLADAERLRLEIMPISGSELQRLMTEIYATPPDIVAKARIILR